MTTLLEKLTGKSTAVFEEFLELNREIALDTSRLNAVTAHVSALQAAAVKAREKFFGPLELSDFKLWVEARQKMNVADSCSQELSRSFGALASRKAGNDAAAKIVVGCLTAMKEALESQIQEFRVEEIGLVGRILGKKSEGDHPEVAKLQKEIAQLDEAVDRIENSDLEPSKAWRNNNGKILEWITQHQPALLTKK